MLSIHQSQVRYALQVASTGSFSEAAERCHVTQSTLSTMIKRLEDQLGFALFDRSSKPISVTPEGHKLIDQCKRIAAEYDQLEAIADELKGNISGHYHIGVIPTIAPFLLPLCLKSFLNLYPDISLSIHEKTTEEIVSLLKERELDIGIVSTPLQDNGLKEWPIYQEEFVVYDPSSQDSTKTYSVSDIDLSRLWLLEEGHCMRNQVQAICELRNRSDRQDQLIYRSGSIHSLIEMVKSNLGVTLLPRLATTASVLVDQAHLHTLEEPVPYREIGIVTHSNFAKKQFLTLLVSHLAELTSEFRRERIEERRVMPF